MGNRKTYQTEQEEFWSADFGDLYVDRNSTNLHMNINLFSQVFSACQEVKSCFEFGTNIGLNLDAIKLLLPNAEVSGIEINKKAYEILSSKYDKCINGSIIDFEPEGKFDLTFSKGVLIHINPEFLETVYSKMYKMSKKYILIAEYYNKEPVEIRYRGENDKLFKRDFAGELMDMFGMNLVNYGFIYHRAANLPHGDVTWFLLEK